jgi:transcriptional repressor NrdR
MKCPYCDYQDTKVIDSRPTEDGHAIRRRRGCERCGKRFTTYEKVEESVTMIIKKDG